MSESRKPDATLTLALPDRESGRVTKHKLELFVAGQFPSEDMQSQRLIDDDDLPTVRVRHNGVWLPPGERMLMTLKQVMSIATSSVAKHLHEVTQ